MAQTSERMRTTPNVIPILKQGSLRARLRKILAQTTATTMIGRIDNLCATYSLQIFCLYFAMFVGVKYVVSKVFLLD